MAIAFASVLASCAALASGTYNYHKSDGTNVWIGAATGGSMKDGVYSVTVKPLSWNVFVFSV